jgi:preprotein translocase subunit SecB
MSEQAKPEGQPAPVQVTVNVQYIKDFSFESPNAPQVFSPSSGAPVINLGVNVQTRGLAENTYEVVLQLKLDAQVEGKTAFIGELAYAGVFTIPPLSEDHLKMFLLIEAPRILFPFARSIMANAVRDGGFPQILINPIDFAAMYQANVAQMNAPAAGSA